MVRFVGLAISKPRVLCWKLVTPGPLALRMRPAGSELLIASNHTQAEVFLERKWNQASILRLMLPPSGVHRGPTFCSSAVDPLAAVLVMLARLRIASCSSLWAEPNHMAASPRHPAQPHNGPPSGELCTVMTWGTLNPIG